MTVSATHAEDDDVYCVPQSSKPAYREGAYAVFVESSRVQVRSSVQPSPGAGGPTVVLVYEESNNVPGIQRGDALEKDRHCTHGRDALVFAQGCSSTATLNLRFGVGFNLNTHGCPSALPVP